MSWRTIMHKHDKRFISQHSDISRDSQTESQHELVLMDYSTLVATDESHFHQSVRLQLWTMRWYLLFCNSTQTRTIPWLSEHLKHLMEMRIIFMHFNEKSESSWNLWSEAIIDRSSAFSWPLSRFQTIHISIKSRISWTRWQLISCLIHLLLIMRWLI
jgi:hypothetical protein